MNSKSVKLFSKFIILYCQSKGLSINPLKLQKLLYYLQVWHIVNFEKDPLFDQLPEAWVNGPVYRKVYNELKDKFFKNQNFVYKFKGEDLSRELQKTLERLKLSSRQKKLLYAVLDNYGVLSDEKLVFLTHKEEPWNIARNGLSPIERSTNEISIENIYNYYSRKITK